MNNYKLGIQISTDARQHHTQATKSTKIQRDLNAELQRSMLAGKQGAAGLKQMEQQANRTASSIRTMGQVVATGAAAMLFVQQAKEASNMAAEIQNVRTRIESLTKSSQDYSSVENYLIELSDSHNKNLLALSDSFSKVLTLEKSGLVTREESMRITEGFSNVQSQLGASTDDLKNSMYGLSQGLSSGVLRAEELNQVVEPLPGLLQELDKAAGLPAGGFRQLVNSGQVTSEFFKTTLLEAFEEYEGAAARTTDNIVADHARHENAYINLIKAYETPIADSTRVVLEATAGAMNVLAENSETVSTIFTGALALALAQGVNLTTNYTAKLVQNVAVKRQAALAALAQAKEEERLALAQRKTAVGVVQVTAAEKRLTAARVQLTAATKKASIASRALSGSLAILGGPAGIITLAAFAAWQFASASDEAADKASKLKQATDELNPYAGFNKDQAERALAVLQVQLETSRQLAKETNTRFNNTFFKNVKIEDVQAAEQKVTDLQGKITALQQVLSKFSGKNKDKPIGIDPDELDKINKKAGTLLARLREQNALHNKGSNEARIRYQLEKGNLVAINDEIKQQLILEAQLLDQKQKRTKQEQQFQSLRSQLQTAAQNENQTHTSNLNVLNNELASTTDVTKRQQINQLIKAEQLRHSEEMKRINQGEASDFDALWENSFDRFAAGIGDATADALFEAEDFGDAMKQVARGAIKQVVAGLVEIGVKRLALATIDQSTAAATTAATTALGVSQAAVLASAYAPAAAGVSLATGGVNGVAAAGALSSNYALAKSLAIAGIAHGGLRKNYDEGTYIIRRDEMMMNPKQRDNFETLLDFTHAYSANMESNRSQSQGGNVFNFGGMTVKFENDNSTPELQSQNADKMYKQFTSKVLQDINRKGPIGKAVMKMARSA